MIGFKDMKDTLLNIASFVPQTFALGPGIRAGLWVQGCPFRCPACIVPEWQPDIENQLVTINEICDQIISSPSVTGLTISGGEPVAQAKSLVQLILKIKKLKDINIISFSGYSLGQLINRIQLYPEIGQYLDLIDVLIDGPYVKKLDDNKGLRGSSNQKIHYLTDKLSFYDFINSPRQVEFHITHNQITMAGIPPHGLLSILDDVADKSQHQTFQIAEVVYER
jgi:anaerobic ribonucleoside-triphosphate reductase activating protein